MAKIERFEDIEAWQEARVLVKMVYELTAQERFSRDYGLKDQIQRAAVSAMTNIAEGSQPPSFCVSWVSRDVPRWRYNPWDTQL